MRIAVIFLCAMLSMLNGTQAKDRSSDESTTNIYTLEHDPGTGQFKKRGSFTITDRGSKTSVKFVENGRISSEDVSAFKSLVARDGFYKVRVLSKESESLSSSSYVVTSIPACQLFLGGFKEKLLIRRDKNDVIFSLDYANPHFPGDCDGLLSQKSSKSGSIRIKSAAIVVEADEAPKLPSIVHGNLFVKGAEKLRQDGKNGKAEGQEKSSSFFARYWHIIVPVGLMMILSNILNPPPPHGQGAAARPAGGGPSTKTA